MSDLFREALIINDFMLVFVKLMCSALFFNQSINLRKTKGKNELILPMAFIFLFIGISRIIYIISDFYYNALLIDEPWSPALLMIPLWPHQVFKLGFFFYLFSISILVLVSERILKGKTRYIGSILNFSATGITLILIIFDDITIFSALNVVFVGISLLGILMALVAFFLIFIKSISGDLRTKMLHAFIGTFILIIGNSLYILEIQQATGLISRFFGAGLKVVALYLFAGAFFTLPSLEEFEWKMKLRKLFIVSRGGITLFTKNFVDEVSELKLNNLDHDAQLSAGGLSGIIELIKEITKSNANTRVIDQENVKILFEYGENCVAILFSLADLQILHVKLEQFINDFELMFGEMLKNWSGNVDLFKPVRFLVQKHFSS